MLSSLSSPSHLKLATSTKSGGSPRKWSREPKLHTNPWPPIMPSHACAAARPAILYVYRPCIDDIVGLPDPRYSGLTMLSCAGQSGKCTNNCWNDCWGHCTWIAWAYYSSFLNLYGSLQFHVIRVTSNSIRISVLCAAVIIQEYSIHDHFHCSGGPIKVSVGTVICLCLFIYLFLFIFFLGMWSNYMWRWVLWSRTDGVFRSKINQATGK